MTTRKTRIRERAEQLLPECRSWAEAWSRASREIRDADRGGRAQPVGDDTIREAADRLFVDRAPGPPVTDEELAEAAGRLFGEHRPPGGGTIRGGGRR